MNRVQHLGLAIVAAAGLATGSARADEGMWTFDNYPSARVEQTLGVKIDKPWLDRVQAATVRLTSGCSASIVSKEGLVLTNDHCIMDCLQSLSDPSRDYFRDGFTTASRAEERRCPGVQAEVLEEVVDITAKIGVATAGKTGLEFVRGRERAVAEAEKAVCRFGPYRCHAISFYRGGQYKIHRYRRYNDVRVAFAPEYASAFFGGDPDNFNFPRFNFDAAFVRLYENDRPASTRNFLRWNAAPPAAGEPVFVPGNPGATERLLTVSQLETLRDIALPVAQLQRAELRGRMVEFARGSPENKRIVGEPLFSLENSFKVYYGRQLALNDAAFMAAKRAEEAELRARVAADPKLAGEIGDPWSEVAAAQGAYARHFLNYRQLEAEAGKGSKLFAYARTLVRGAQERRRPNAERLPEFLETRLSLEEKRLLDAKPVRPALEQLYLEHWLSKTREYLTADAPATKVLLGRESPEALSRRLVEGTKLADPAVRKALWEGGMAAVEASDDPMIRFVLAADAAARAARRAWEGEVSGPTDQASERIARARFAVYGDSVYPDATFTLRLSHGKVAGWTHRGVTVAPFTTFAGLYDRATGAEPYALAPRWIAAKERLDPNTVFNFVTDNDITGGNSGSPAVNARGEIIGLAFDGNIHSLGGAYGYDGSINRMVAVSTGAITEALTKVYGQDRIVRELTGR